MSSTRTNPTNKLGASGERETTARHSDGGAYRTPKEVGAVYPHLVKTYGQEVVDEVFIPKFEEMLQNNQGSGRYPAIVAWSHASKRELKSHEAIDHLVATVLEQRRQIEQTSRKAAQLSLEDPPRRPLKRAQPPSEMMQQQQQQEAQAEMMATQTGQPMLCDDKRAHDETKEQQQQHGSGEGQIEEGGREEGGREKRQKTDDDVIAEQEEEKSAEEQIVLTGQVQNAVVAYCRESKPVPAPCERPASSIGQKATAQNNSYELRGEDSSGSHIRESGVHVELSRTKYNTSKIKINFKDVFSIYPCVFYPELLPKEFKPLPSEVRQMNFDDMQAWLQNARSKGGLDFAIEHIVHHNYYYDTDKAYAEAIKKEMSKVDAVIDAFYALGGDNFVVVQESTGTSKKENYDEDDEDSDMDEESRGPDCDPNTYECSQTQTISLVTKIFQVGAPPSKTSTVQLTLACTGEVTWSC